MKPIHLRKVIVMAALFIGPMCALAQWDKKQPGEWNEKDAKKLLSDSPWAQSQTFADPNQSTRTARSNDQSQTAIVEEVYATLRVRFFSSKPIRQAIARTLALQLGEKITEEQTAQLKQMAEFDFSNQIVVTVLVDSSKPSQFSRQAMATLGRLTTESLKGKTYLEVKGAKRVDLQEYQRPQRDGFGARLIFPRLVDGQPVIAETSEVIVNSELGGPFSIKMKFKAKDMVYQGKLDY